MHLNEYTCTWKIENFSFCDDSNGYSLFSCTFYPKNFEDTECHFRLYPYGVNEEYSDFISLFLIIYTDDSINFLQSEVKVIGSSGKVLKTHKWNDFSSQCFAIKLEWPDFLAIKDVVQDAEGSVEDNLTICCKIYGKKSYQIVSEETFLCTKIGVNRHVFELQVHEGETKKCVLNFESKGNFELSVTETSGKLKITILRLNLEASEVNFEPCVVDCTLTLKKIFSSAIYSVRKRHYFSPLNCSDLEFPSEILSEQWKTYRRQIEEDYSHCLDIYCEFYASSGTNLTFDVSKAESTSSRSKADASPPSSTTNTSTYPSLQEDLRNLFHSKELSDVKFQVGDETIASHKNLLVARSPVFKAMFDHQDMIENRGGVVDITDIDVHILKLFLQFLYTDSVEEMDYENAVSLLMVAEKYQVLSLKEKCAMFLRNEMSVNNACEIVSLADAVNHEYLKSASIEFIISNSATILSSPQWITWMENNMKSASYILSKLTRSLIPVIANPSGSS